MSDIEKRIKEIVEFTRRSELYQPAPHRFDAEKAIKELLAKTDREARIDEIKRAILLNVVGGYHSPSRTVIEIDYASERLKVLQSKEEE